MATTSSDVTASIAAKEERRGRAKLIEPEVGVSHGPTGAPLSTSRFQRLCRCALPVRQERPGLLRAATCFRLANGLRLAPE